MIYQVVRTDTADAGIRQIVLYIAENFGRDIALVRLDELEESILALGDNPYLGSIPSNLILKRQGFRVLILKKDLAFYKIDETLKKVIIYAVMDQRQDCLSIIRGL